MNHSSSVTVYIKTGQTRPFWLKFSIHLIITFKQIKTSLIIIMCIVTYFRIKSQTEVKRNSKYRIVGMRECYTQQGNIYSLQRKWINIKSMSLSLVNTDNEARERIGKHRREGRFLWREET